MNPVRLRLLAAIGAVLVAGAAWVLVALSLSGSI
jgi:hypothetical protein